MPKRQYTKLLKIDPRFFYVLGSFKGDGHYNISQNKIQIAVTDLEFLEEIKRIFNMLSPETRMNILFYKKATEKTKKQWRMNICSREFYKKKLHLLLPTNLQEKRFYLKGLFDAEGSVSKNGSSITISQKNIEDIKLWKKWLEELGITTTMGIRYVHNANGKESFVIGEHGYLRVLGNDSKINFYDVIGFKIKRKQKRLEDYIKKINPLPEYSITNELNNLKGVKVKSIKFSHREQGVDLSILNSKYHNFVLDNGVVTSNSTLAQQIGYFLAWLLAGGTMAMIGPDGNRWLVDKRPDKEVRFDLKDNIVFSPEELMKKASDLFKKYGMNQVIVYDEGRAGLDSARAMQAINKVMQDFFQECGQYGHVIIIVLPSFFKLHEDYATSRSLFLVDVFADKNLRRGYFNFYTERQKEYLFLNGKKRLGTIAKYAGCNSSFMGRFTKFLPVPSDDYNKAKQKALKTKDLNRTDRKWKQQRDAALYLIRRETEMKYSVLAREMTVICGFPISSEMVSMAVSTVTKVKEKAD